MRRSSAIDKDGSGTIELPELRQALQRFDMKLTAEQLNKIIALLDTDGNNEISYSELAAAFVRAGETEEPAGSYEEAMSNAIMKRSTEARHRSLNESQEVSNQQTEEERTAKRREAEQASVIEVMLNAVKGKRTLFGKKLDNPRALFEAMDKDGSSSISVKEFEQAIDRLGLGLTAEQVQAVVDTIDADGNGEIVYEEFLDRLWRHVEMRMAERDAAESPGLSALQIQEQQRKKEEQEAEDMRAAPTEEQAKIRAQALVANRMGVLKNAVMHGSATTDSKVNRKARKLYGVDVTSVATLFCAIDKDGSGSIDTHELHEALKRMGLELSEEQLKLIVADIDKDQNLELSYQELCDAIGIEEDDQMYVTAKAEADARREKQKRKDEKKERTLSKAETEAHESERAQKRTQAARDNIMRVLRLATKPFPPSTLRPRGGHRTLYGKKLTDQLSVFEAIDKDSSGDITVEELMDALVRLGADVAEEQLREMLTAFDTDGNGVLNKHEFFLAADAERAAATAKAKKKAGTFNKNAKALPTKAGGAANAAGGATRRRRAGGGWHVSSRPTIWSKMLSAHPAKIGRSVKSSQNQAGLGAVGTMVSGHTSAPCWSLAAAAYVSPDYDPTPPRSGFGISDGDPVMCWPPTRPDTWRVSKTGKPCRVAASPDYGRVAGWEMNVSLGRSPKVQVRVPDPDGTSELTRVRTCSAGATVRRRRRMHALGLTATKHKKNTSVGIRKNKLGQQPSKRSMSLASAALRSSTAGEIKSVKVKSSAGSSDITVSSADTVGDLKRRCEEVWKLEAGAMDKERLVFAGKSMGDSRTLGECGVYDEAVLTVHKPSVWATHLQAYKYKTLQYWDRSTVQASRRIKKTKSSRPTVKAPIAATATATTESSSSLSSAAAAAEEKDLEVNKLAAAAAEAHKKSLARTLQRQVHAELTKRHVSARAAFSAFVSSIPGLATVDDLRRGFEELGVRMPIGANGKRPQLAGVINDVLLGMVEKGEDSTQVGGRVRKLDGSIVVDETAFQLWIAPEPSEVATVYTEKILAEASDGQGDVLGPPESKAVARAQRAVDAIETQLEEMQRQISTAEAEHQKTLEVEQNVSARRAVEMQRLEVEYKSSQEVRSERKQELAEALAKRKAAVQARKEAEAARYEGATSPSIDQRWPRTAPSLLCTSIAYHWVAHSSLHRAQNATTPALRTSTPLLQSTPLGVVNKPL
eukprot:COSAG02_NODE_3121_length_7326_cov_29.940501_5_plen_1210_part_00